MDDYFWRHFVSRVELTGVLIGWWVKWLDRYSRLAEQ